MYCAFGAHPWLNDHLCGYLTDHVNDAIGPAASHPGNDHHQPMNDMRRRNEAGHDHGAGLAHGAIIYLVALLLTLPLFIILYPIVPEMTLPIGKGCRVDHILSFIMILIALIVLVKRFQLVVYGALVIGLACLTITSLTGRYGFRDLYRDYAMFLHSLSETTLPLPLMLKELKPFPDAELLRSRVDDQEPSVRTFAVRAATTYFADVRTSGEDYTLVQAFSVFRVINSSWTYVSDVRNGEYFAKASESVGLLAGDCDDHAILMAACIKAIGGEARLVRTAGHIYPEMKVGDAKRMERVAYLIREELFPDIASHATLYYHTDAHGDRWINLDYTRHYPGGEVMDEKIEGILNV